MRNRDTIFNTSAFGHSYVLYVLLVFARCFGSYATGYAEISGTDRTKNVEA